MSRGWESVFAVAGLLVMLCELAAGPAQAQYTYPYPYPARRRHTGQQQPRRSLRHTRYLWGGRRFCWYDNAWNGPGWYRCGYAFRRGYGWGGGYGWNGWVWRGGYGWRGPGWRGDHYHH